MDPVQASLPVGRGSNAFEQWENLADQSRVPCPTTRPPSVIIYPLHLIPSKMLDAVSSGHLHVWLDSPVCVLMNKSEEREWAHVYVKEQARMCLSGPANQLAAALSLKPVQTDGRSIWSGRCCNDGPGAAERGCYLVFMSRSYIPSAKQRKTLTFFKSLPSFPPLLHWCVGWCARSLARLSQSSHCSSVFARRHVSVSTL